MAATGAQLDELIERVRVATYEHPMAHSATEWRCRLSEMFREVCCLCGANEDDHEGIMHEDGTTAYAPMLFYVPLNGWPEPFEREAFSDPERTR